MVRNRTGNLFEVWLVYDLGLFMNPLEVLAMLRWTQFKRPQHIVTVATMLLAISMAAVPCQRAFALIRGGEGNSPIPDPGWPKGAAAIFNNPARIAYWIGLPYSGGQGLPTGGGEVRRTGKGNPDVVHSAQNVRLHR